MGRSSMVGRPLLRTPLRLDAHTDPEPDVNTITDAILRNRSRRRLVYRRCMSWVRYGIITRVHVPLVKPVTVTTESLDLRIMAVVVR